MVITTGATYRNDQGLLPDRDRGDYGELAVSTPGSDDRGASFARIAR